MGRRVSIRPPLLIHRSDDFTRPCSLTMPMRILFAMTQRTWTPGENPRIKYPSAIPSCPCCISSHPRFAARMYRGTVSGKLGQPCSHQALVTSSKDGPACCAFGVISEFDCQVYTSSSCHLNIHRPFVLYDLNPSSRSRCYSGLTLYIIPAASMLRMTMSMAVETVVMCCTNEMQSNWCKNTK